jgi:hypothetical protein
MPAILPFLGALFTTAGGLSTVAGLASAGVGIGEAVSSADAQKTALADASKPPAAAAPTPITAPTAPQINSAANTQFLTGGGVGAAPDYLAQLLQSTSGQPQNPAVDLTALQGYLS